MAGVGICVLISRLQAMIEVPGPKLCLSFCTFAYCSLQQLLLSRAQTSLMRPRGTLWGLLQPEEPGQTAAPQAKATGKHWVCKQK